MPDRDLKSNYRVLIKSTIIITDTEILDWMSKQSYVEASSDSGSGRTGIQWRAISGITLREAAIRAMTKNV